MCNSMKINQKRQENSAQNYSAILKIALNLLKNDKTVKQGLNARELRQDGTMATI